MKTILFDDSPDDLVRMADARQLNEAMRRYIRADHGYRRQRLRKLRAEVLRQLGRETDRSGA